MAVKMVGFQYYQSDLLISSVDHHEIRPRILQTNQLKLQVHGEPVNAQAPL